MVITKKVVNRPVEEEKKKNVRRTAAYARVSTESIEQGESFDSQVSYYKNLIERDMNSVLVGIYGDKGISGLSGFLASTLGGLLVNYIQENGNTLFGIPAYAQQVLSFIGVLFTLAGILWLIFGLKKEKTEQAEI